MIEYLKTQKAEDSRNKEYLGWSFFRKVVQEYHLKKEHGFPEELELEVAEYLLQSRRIDSRYTPLFEKKMASRGGNAYSKAEITYSSLIFKLFTL